MKKFGYATVITSGLAALFIGLAAPAQAADAPAVLPVNDSTAVIAGGGLDHLGWINDIQPKVNVPQVDTSPRHHGNR